MIRSCKQGVALCPMLCLMAGPAAANNSPGVLARGQQEIQGRTGLPTVKVGGQKVWVEKATVQIHTSGAFVMVEQDFRLHYPGKKIESKKQLITVAARDEYSRTRDGKPALTTAGARGLMNLSVYIDGKNVRNKADAWVVNDKGDT